MLCLSVSDIAMALICELRDTKDNTFSAHKTHELKTHLSHQKCAKTHVRQSGIKKFFRGLYPRSPAFGGAASNAVGKGRV